MAATDICIKPTPPSENSLNSGAASLAIFRKATSFEDFAGLRLELLPLRRNTTAAASTLYVKGQLGFLTVAGQAGDVRDIHHAGLGLMLTNGPLAGSYFEIGRGINDCFLDGKKRFKLDALVLFDTGRAVTPFAQLVVDADMGDAPTVFRATSASTSTCEACYVDDNAVKGKYALMFEEE